MTKVVQQSVGSDKKIIGSFLKNSVLNSLLYEVEFMDGAIKQYSENLIAKKILMNADSSGYNNHTLAGILISRKDDTALT